MSEKNERPESFSIASAQECAEEIFRKLSKPKQREMLGELNEILVVLGRVPCEDRSAEYRP